MQRERYEFKHILVLVGRLLLDLGGYFCYVMADGRWGHTNTVIHIEHRQIFLTANADRRAVSFTLAE